MAGVIDGTPVDAATTNPAFCKINDTASTDSMQGRYNLSNNVAASGPEVANVQREINSLNSFTGRVAGTAFDVLPSWTNNDVGASTDTVKLRADNLTQKFNVSTGHAHDGTAGNGAPIVANQIANTPLLGYFNQGTDLTGVTGTTTDVTTQLTGKVFSNNSTTAGVVVNTPFNKAVIRQASGTSTDDEFVDAFGNVVYGRVTFGAGTWTLSYYVLLSGTETAYSFSSSEVRWYYQELYNPLDNPPVYSQLAIVPSDNLTQDIVDATSTQRGLVSTGTQSFGGAKTFTDTTQSTTKDTGAVILEGGLGVEKNINAGGTVLGSNLSGTNTGDVTLAAVGSSPNANAASLSGQVLTLQPASSSFPGVMTALSQTLAGVKAWVNGQIFQKFIATNKLDVASAASITALSSTNSFDKLTGSTATTLHGIVAGEDGQHMTLHNGSSATLTVKNQSGSASAADRIITTSGTDVLVTANATIEFIYDTSQSRWLTKSISISASSSAPIAPTTQKFTSGSGTYTTPANVLYIRVRAVGGGGGGAGGGTTNGAGGSNGGNTTFGTTLIVANGGVLGTRGGYGGAGGTASTGAAVGVSFTGGQGGTAPVYSGAANTTIMVGGQGGASSLAGGGAGGSFNNTTSGGVGITGAGSGGGGGGVDTVSNGQCGAGGGAGGYVDAYITSPAASYSYAVGALGSGTGAGTNGGSGADGGRGEIIVDEYYQ